MDFFTEMKRSLETTGRQVAKKTRDFSDTLQIKSRIAAEGEVLDGLYRSIGKKVYEQAAEEDRKRFFEEFVSIEKSLKRKAELEEELAKVDGSIFCSECGAKLEKDAVFCSRCGSRVSFYKKPEAKKSGEDTDDGTWRSADGKQMILPVSAADGTESGSGSEAPEVSSSSVSEDLFQEE